jgi:hypothetical protein
MGARQTWEFRLGTAHTGTSVEVRLECFGHRWVAAAADKRRTEIGLGSTARSALTAAIRSLAPRSATALLADPELFVVSWRIRQAV